MTALRTSRPLPVQSTQTPTGSGPCREYDEDCDDMTVAQIQACHANPGPSDDTCGYCVMKHRCT